MVSTVENAKEMSFLDIGESYPDKYILVKIIELDYSKGKEIGIALYISDNWKDLEDIIKKEGLLEGTTILTGDNLIPVLGGLL